ncbi:MAG: hypothetical protein WC209_14330 [Ignavibacteriaceae bacterium]|jgi:hypothetical protein
MVTENSLNIDDLGIGKRFLLKELSLGKNPIILRNKNKNVAIVQNIDDYEKQKRLLLMLKLLVQGDKDVEIGKVKEQSEVFDRLKNKLKKRNGK